ncbi:acetyl esterase [Neorhizobium galegae]|uniref:alpha/beta hydrolase n=1 Tax=Neorhizobium galegae TaxID=399 RepID=UPI001AE68011|nr:alpha/beta hydrolase [Neorhizobium galegae]MBP2561127.1 acetyl esterase [Neorhizobium galegae]MDQ0134124.1 acetyl esterase [Neorhizobium galegae]
MQVLIDARRPSHPNPTVAEQRENWNAYAARLSRPHPDTLEVTERVVPGKGVEVPVRIYRPKAAQGLTGCMIYMHGGGFMLGDLDSSDSVAWGFAAETGATVISVDYRLTPENRWPAGFDDCCSVLEWAAAAGPEIGIDPDRLTIGGDSAGGRYAACMSLKARDANGPKIRAQVIIYGNGGPIENAGSMLDFGTGFGLTAARTSDFARKLFPEGAPKDDPVAFPIFAADLSRLPPTLVHVAEFDPIRDAGRAYAARLVQAGVDVTFREARGMIHGFMRARFTGAQAAKEYKVICDFLAEHMR